MRLMITNGPGGHPSWKHAEITADRLIVDPAPGVADYAAKMNAAGELRHKVKSMLEPHHEKVKQHEIGQLKTKGKARHGDPLQPEAAHVNDAVAAVVALTKGTVLEEHYAKPEVQKAMADVLAREFRTQQHIHRQWDNVAAAPSA